MDYMASKLPLSQKVLSSTVNNLKDFALNKGIAMCVPELQLDIRVPAPLCLRPSPFPRYWFNLARSIQSDINLVIHKVAHDYEFLKQCLESTLEVDTFTSRIFEMYTTVLKEGLTQKVSLGLLRSDYMLHIQNDENADSDGKQLLKQVEINTISSGFAGLAPKVGNLHRYILNNLGIENYDDHCPENNATSSLAAGIISAWKIYDQPNSVILFVIEERVSNICDQRDLEYFIFQQKSSALIIRHTFSELRQMAVLKNRCLFVDDREVAVIYYRTGYSPDLYDPEDWDLRLMMERSKAIKCPSVHYHLAGTKKVQQVLSQPGVLERFLLDQIKVDRLRQVFCGQYSLELNAEGDKAAEMAINNPKNFVMKPQREGGGNNLYNNEIKVALERMGSGKERQGYILMERINSPKILNYIVKRGRMPELCKVISELGVYGVILGDKDKVMLNYEAGFLLRSKDMNCNEGGISAGFGALDSPFLT